MVPKRYKMKRKSLYTPAVPLPGGTLLSNLFWPLQVYMFLEGYLHTSRNATLIACPSFSWLESLLVDNDVAFLDASVQDKSPAVQISCMCASFIPILSNPNQGFPQTLHRTTISKLWLLTCLPIGWRKSHFHCDFLCEIVWLFMYICSFFPLLFRHPSVHVLCSFFR